MNEVICETCGSACPVENVKGHHCIAWCDECGDYATSGRDLDREHVERVMDYAKINPALTD